METRKHGGKTALYFEDQPDTVRGIVDYLRKKLGFRVVQAASPEEAFAQIETKKFDLLILDVRIMDGQLRRDGITAQDWRRYGLYFLEEVRKERAADLTPADVPVLVITCVVNTADVEALERLGSSGARYRYLEKPLESLSQVADAIDYLLPA